MLGAFIRWNRGCEHITRRGICNLENSNQVPFESSSHDGFNGERLGRVGGKMESVACGGVVG